jgi:hypothetical protein
MPFFYHVPFPGKGHGQHTVIRLRVLVQVQVQGMTKNLSCDWLTRFILLELSLVSTRLQYRRTQTGLEYKHTAVQLIQA